MLYFSHSIIDFVSFKLTFPDHNNLPSSIMQSLVFLLVTLAVTLHLCYPEISVAFRDRI